MSFRLVVRAPYLVVALIGSACATLQRSGLPTQSEIWRADEAIALALRTEQSIDVISVPPHSVSVAPFADFQSDRDLHWLGVGLADLLATDLAKSASIVVVERLFLAALLRELNLATSGRVDTMQAPRFGKLLGARRVVTGAVGDNATGQLGIQAVITDITTGRREGTAATAANADALIDAEKRIAFAVFDELGVNLTPAERASIETRQTRHLGALLAFSRGVSNEYRGDYGTAIAEYRSAAQLDPSFGLATSRVRDAELRRAEFERLSQHRQRNREGSMRALSLASEGLVRPGAVGASAADASFIAARQTLTIIIQVTIP